MSTTMNDITEIGTIHEWFDQTARALPESTALVTDDSYLTFAQLSERRDQYISFLQGNGVGVGDTVAFHGASSPDLVAGMLATMHLGAVAVPLGNTLPREYRAHIVQRCGAVLIFSDAPDMPGAIDWLPKDIAVTRFKESFRPQKDTPFLLMFTSGSTGTPKGVLHSHRQPINRFRWMHRTYPMCEDDVCCARPTVSIMPAMWELFGGLVVGRPTLLLSSDLISRPDALVRSLVDHKVTRMTTTPALHHVMLTSLQNLSKSTVASLRVLTIGGERIPDKLVEKHRALLPSCHLLEDYGATEVNTIGAGVREDDGNPVFFPIDGVSVRLAPLSEGDSPGEREVGELCVAGEGLALGYWKDPEQTSKRFVSRDSINKEYLTGDRAKLLPDGSFILLGRIREQIKINGQTVDLTAIENVLRAEENVTGAAAFVISRPQSNWKQLYAVITGDSAASSDELRERVRSSLPPHMIPGQIFSVEELPKLPSGKIDKEALAASMTPSPDIQLDERNDCVKYSTVLECLEEVLGDRLQPDDLTLTWSNLGLDSLSMVALAQTLTERLGFELNATDLFSFPTPARLLKSLPEQIACSDEEVKDPESRSRTVSEQPQLAITGMAATVPGGIDLEAFWEIIRHGKVIAPHVPLERWPGERTDDPDLRATVMSDVMSLDPDLHELTQHEVEAMDPQLRVFLRVVRQCLLEAGLSSADLSGKRVGLFVGCRPSGFSSLLEPSAAKKPEFFLGTDEAMFASQVAHRLDLRGPTLTVNTTCSSGLVALHIARQSLGNGECDIAIVAATSVICDPDFLRKTAKLGVTSPTGVCRPFDADADGFVPSEGAGCLVLEATDQAEREGRTSWAFLLESGIGHDGLSSSLTAPNGMAQTELLKRVHSQLPDFPSRLAYVETHGTGTALGDPVEGNSLASALSDVEHRVSVGSLKGNIGHANAAASLLGLIKTVLCMAHGVIPPLAGFERANSHLDGNTQRLFDFPTRPKSWPAKRDYAAVSAFGMSGTNSHVVLQRAPFSAPNQTEKERAVAVRISAPTPALLRDHAASLASVLSNRSNHSFTLNAVASTLNKRSVDQVSVWFEAESLVQLVEQLTDLAKGLPVGAQDQPTHAFVPPLVTSLHLPVSNEVRSTETAVEQVMFHESPSNNLEPNHCVQTSPRVHSQLLRDVCSTHLGISDWDGRETISLRDLGLDSIKALSLSAALEHELQLKVKVFDLLEGANLLHLEKMVDNSLTTPESNSRKEPPTESFPNVWATAPEPPESAVLTDLQAVYMTAKLTGRTMEDKLGAWNLLVLSTEERIDRMRLEEAWGRVQDLHGMLRVSFDRNGRQFIKQQKSTTIPITNGDSTEVNRVLNQMMVQASVSTRVLPVRLHLVRSPERDQLLVTTESIAIDLRSTWILLDDLWLSYRGQPLQRRSHPNAFLSVADRQVTDKSSNEAQEDLEYWKQRVNGYTPANVDLLRPSPNRSVSESSGWARLSYHLDEAENASIFEQARLSGTTVPISLMSRFRDWLVQRSQEPLLIALTVANRPMDLASYQEVVGPFTEMMLHPVSANNGDPSDLQTYLNKDLSHRRVSGNAVLRDLGIEPPRIVLSAVDLPRSSTPFHVTRALSITSGVQLHVHATRVENDGIVLAWDFDTACLSRDQAQELFNDFCRKMTRRVLSSSSKVMKDTALHRSAGMVKAPLTIAMRSYKATQLSSPQKDIPSYVSRVYPLTDAQETEGLSQKWSRFINSQPALRSLITTQGQFLSEENFVSANVPFYQDIDDQDRNLWIERVQKEESEKLGAYQWPSVRLAIGQHGDQRFAFFTFNCHVIDAVSTLLIPQVLLADTHSNFAGDDCFDYPSWQLSKKEPDSAQYWSRRIKALQDKGLTPAPRVLHGERIILQKTFEKVPEEFLSARLVSAFQTSLGMFPRLASLPTMVVDFPDRAEKDSWQKGIGDFSTFGFVPPRTQSNSLKTVQEILCANRSHRRIDWFPLLAEIVEPGSTLFPSVFTDATGSGLFESSSSAIRTSSSTAGVSIDCLAYKTENGLNVEWSVDPELGNIKLIKEAFKIFKEEMILQKQTIPEEPSLRPVEEPQAQAINTDVPFNTDTTIVGLFDRAVEEHSEKTALTGDGFTWTYKQLSETVERFATSLKHHSSIGAGDVVGVQMHRGPNLPAMLLAVMRVGAAFVPINDSEAVERQRYMLKQSGACLLITDEADFDAFEDIPTLSVSQLEKKLEVAPSEDLSVPNGLAYVIFTSGSTGTPKGVMVRHSPVINLFEDLQKRYHFDSNDKGIWVNSVSFDLTIFDLFGLLAQGACVRMVNETDRLDPIRISQIICDEKVTFWNSAPAYFHPVAKSLMSDRMRIQCSLRLAFLSGDWIPLSLARQCLNKLPRMTLVALGGATEAVIWSNLHEVTSVPDSWHSIPYGRPIQNARYYILGEDGNSVPIGKPGELYISGACLADGYINDPELTNDSFVPNPFDPPSLMYRTGDLAQFLPNGEIEFLGRSDRQVKINGNRIELTEVEQALEKAGYHSPIVLSTTLGPTGAGTDILSCFFIGEAPEKARTHLNSLLPPHMQPSQFFAVEHYPTTVNGKVDVQALKQMAESDDMKVLPTRKSFSDVEPLSQTMERHTSLPLAGDSETVGSPTVDREKILGIVAEILDCSPDSLNLDLGLAHQGFNSLHFALLAAQLTELARKDIGVPELLSLPSLESLIDHVVPVEVNSGSEKEYESANKAEDADSGLIAVIGMHGSMPKAHDIEAFWKNVVDGIDCIEEIPEDRWDWRFIYGNSPDRNETTSRWGGFLPSMNMFDHERFSVSPREAATMDPRQRLILTGAWRLLEKAGYAPTAKSPLDIGLFLGATGDEFASLLNASGATQDQLTLTGTGRSFISNRVSYALNWSGPSEVIDTTCSSSLVAIHHAISALKNGDCKMAVAGGISVLMDPQPHIALSKAGVLAEDGRCKTFDVRADGYVRSEAIGLVLLKPLEDALREGDQIRAVVRSCQISHGGRSSSLTAPNSEAQTALIDRALEEAGPGIETHVMHEAHGTGTRLGDPIEIASFQKAIKLQAHREGLSKLPHPVSVGSVKSSIGHTEAAAGVTGFIKAVLSLERRVIPPLVHFTGLNPEIHCDNELIQFDRVARPFNPIESTVDEKPRRASVSAFGFGGVNAFAVLEEAPRQEVNSAPPKQDLFVLSSHNRECLLMDVENLVQWLQKEGQQASLQDIAFTLRNGRSQDRWRIAVVADSHQELIAALQQATPERVKQGQAPQQLREMLISGNLHSIASLWPTGGDANWSLLPQGGDQHPNRLSLPVSSLAEVLCQHHVFNHVRSSRRATWRSPTRTADGVYYRVTALDGFLKDHRVMEQETIPGAAWIEAILREVGTPAHLSDLVFMRPFTLNGHPCVDVTVSRKNGRVSVTAADKERSKLCSAQISEHNPETQQPERLQDFARTYDHYIDAHECLATLKKGGADYGPLYQIAAGCWYSDDELLLHVRLPHGAYSAQGAPIPMIDSLFQGIVLFEMVSGSNTSRVPVHIDSLDVLRTPSEEGYVRVVPMSNGRHKAYLYDETGSPILKMVGVLGKEPMAITSPTGVESETVGYSPSWAPSNLALDNTVNIEIREESLEPIVSSGTTESLFEYHDHVTLTFNSSIRAEKALSAISAITQDAVRKASSAIRPITLVVKVYADSDEGVQVAHGVAGLSESLRFECPSLSVSALIGDSTGQNSVMALHQSRSRGLYREYQGALETLVLTPVSPLPHAHQVDHLCKELEAMPGFVLISGGAGGIGAMLTDMLCHHGISVVAFGRSPAPSLGFPPKAHYQPVDIRDLDSLSAAVSECREKFGPVKAVFHCAGVSPNGLFSTRRKRDIEEQLDVKLTGIRNLDQATKNDSPSVFIAFSSLIAHLGMIGCADYGMANRAMESFIDQRSHSRTGHSLAVAWSAWAGDGMRLSDAQKQKVAEEGIVPITIEAGMSWLSHLLHKGVSVVLSPHGKVSRIRERLETRLLRMGKSDSLPG